jgi:hypothetical protein
MVYLLAQCYIYPVPEYGRRLYRRTFVQMCAHFGGKLKKLLFAIATFAFAANAAIVVDLLPVGPGGVSVPGVPGVYQYQYDVDLTANSSLNKDDFFVFYDVSGFVNAFVTAVPGIAWEVTTQDVGPNPSSTVGPPSDTSVINVKFRFLGPDTLVNSSLDSLDLGQFNINSSVSTVNENVVGGQKSGESQGIDNVGGPAAVPEPGTMSLMGASVLGLGIIARRRK